MVKTKHDLSKTLKVAKKLGVSVEFTSKNNMDSHGLDIDESLYESRGSWPGHGKTIYLNPRTATRYTVLHEIGHVLNGHMCCREHCEFAAHGAAIALAKAFDVNLGIYSKYECDPYAGRSSRKACGAIELHKAGFSGYEEYSRLYSKRGKVTRVLDNATFMIDNKGRPLVIKGIKPIEKGTTNQVSEKKKLEKLIKGKTVIYDWIETNVYGRKVCNVWVLDKNEILANIKNVNKVMKK